MATAPPNEQQQNVQRGLEYLKGSDQIIGDIVVYCVNAYKADPQPKTLDRIRQYVQDTANSVSEHVLTIAHNISKMLEQETKEIEQLSYETGFVAHRLQTSQSFMCELFMTKFQVYPRPRKTVHMMRKTIPEDQLPKHSRPKRWVREKAFDYTILDGISNDKPVEKPIGTLKQRNGRDESITSMSPMSPIVSAPPPLSAQISDPQTPPIPIIPKADTTKNQLPTIPSIPTIPAIPKANTGPPSVPPIPGPSAIGGGSEEPPEEVKPFLKMLKVGVPRSGVESKMQAAGLDPALLDKYVDVNQPKVGGGGGNTASSRPPNPMIAALKARNAAPNVPTPPSVPGTGGPPPPVPRPPT